MLCAGSRDLLDNFPNHLWTAENFRAEDFVGLRFVRELEQSGFIDNLYR
jgi:hypothetical protein